jgi:F0F1-type ATP synthase alpha subunit
MVELLKQDQAKPLAVEHQVLLIKSAAEGVFDSFPASYVRQAEADFLVFLDSEYPEFEQELATKKVIGDENEKKLKEAVKRFVMGFKERNKL